MADPERAIGRLDILGAAERHAILRDVERDRARGAGLRRCPSCSRRRLRARRRRSRWCSRTERLSYARARCAARTGWRIICAGSGSGPRRWWGSAWSARWRWWWGCSASSRPAAPICRSTRTIRPSGWRSCWRMPARRCWCTRARRCARSLAGADDAHVVLRLDADWPAIARQPATAPAAGLAAAPPRLRHLHLGLDRNTKGRRRHACGISRNLAAVQDRSTSRSTSEPACSAVRIASASMLRLGKIVCRCCMVAPAVVLIDASATAASRRMLATSYSCSSGLCTHATPALLVPMLETCLTSVPLQTLDRCAARRASPNSCDVAVGQRLAGRDDQRVWSDRDARSDATMSDAYRATTRPCRSDRPSDLEHAGLRSGRWSWSLFLLALRASFTSRGLGWRGAIWVVRV